jgi:hypothetical protein
VPHPFAFFLAKGWDTSALNHFNNNQQSFQSVRPESPKTAITLLRLASELPMTPKTKPRIPKTKPRNQNLIVACFVALAILILLLRLFVFVHGHSRRTYRTASPATGGLLLAPRNPPRLDKLPVNINRMI